MNFVMIYRQLLRSVGQAFKGDAGMLAAAHLEVRSKFESARVVPDGGQLEQMQAEGREAADFLRTMVVQAPMNERGNYEMVVDQDHTNMLAEPVEPGMDLPRERRRAGKGAGGVRSEGK